MTKRNLKIGLVFAVIVIGFSLLAAYAASKLTPCDRCDEFSELVTTRDTLAEMVRVKDLEIKSLEKKVRLLEVDVRVAEFKEFREGLIKESNRSPYHRWFEPRIPIPQTVR